MSGRDVVLGDGCCEGGGGRSGGGGQWDATNDMEELAKVRER